MIPNSPDWQATDVPPGDVPHLDNNNPGRIEDYVQAIRPGPYLLNDSRGSLFSRYWIVFYDQGVLHLRGADPGTWGPDELTLVEPQTVVDIDFTFDQLGRIILFYVLEDGTSKLFWFDPTLPGPTILVIGMVSSLAAGFDLINDTGRTDSDAMIAYVRNGSLYWRLQRDRWAIEYDPGVSDPTLEVLSMEMNTNFKFQIQYRIRISPANQIPLLSEEEGTQVLTVQDGSLEQVVIQNTALDSGTQVINLISGELISEVVNINVTVTGDQTGEDGAQTTITVVSPPLVNSGDLYIAAAMWRGPTPPTTPPGWTLVGQYQDLGLGKTYVQHVSIYSMVGTSPGNMVSVTIEGTAANRMAMMVFAVENGLSISNVTTQEYQGGTGAPSIVTTAPNTICISHNLHGTSQVTTTGGTILGDTTAVSHLKMAAAFNPFATTYTFARTEDSITTDQPTNGLIVLTF